MHYLKKQQRLREQLEERLRTYDEKKENLEKKAKEKARKIVDDAKAEAEKIIAELRRNEKECSECRKRA